MHRVSVKWFWVCNLHCQEKSWFLWNLSHSCLSSSRIAATVECQFCCRSDGKLWTADIPRRVSSSTWKCEWRSPSSCCVCRCTWNSASMVWRYGNDGGLERRVYSGRFCDLFWVSFVWFMNKQWNRLTDELVVSAVLFVLLWSNIQNHCHLYYYNLLNHTLLEYYLPTIHNLLMCFHLVCLRAFLCLDLY